MEMRYSILTVLVVPLLGYLCSATVNLLSTNDNNSRDFRLPKNILPTKYNLKLFVVLDPLPGYERFSATGEVSINVICLDQTNLIFLHAANLTIFNDTISVSDSSGYSLKIDSLKYEVENDFLIISLSKSLQVEQSYKIYINFVAPIPDYRLNGMYQDYYEDPETLEKSYLATTLFAPYHTRRLFPCFDEPSFRAEYEVELGHHSKYHAMANEIMISSRSAQEHPDYQWDTFKTTPSISSYITAMIVSDFTYEEAPPTYFHNKTIRVYASPHLIAKGASEYATNITDAVMAFLENRFRVKYPLGKLFSIALPHFFFSAMENIGMITYKEPVLLYLKNETTEEERFQINSVMSHELSHQWFGNIVACKWWAYVWLKEGFSTFYSYYGMNHTNPELEPWDMFLPKVLQTAMAFDSSNATHPLENFPPSSAEVANIYTAIPYQKGASILRMTSTFLTEEVFEEGIKIYINRFQYSSAEQNDLFDALQEALDKHPPIHQHIPNTVREIMNSWCRQSNFPLIIVRRDGNHIELSQVTKTLYQTVFSEEGTYELEKTWWVPITLQPRSQPNLPDTVPDLWIPLGVTSLTMNVSNEGPIIVDPAGTGYYRVEYDDIMQRDILLLMETDHTSIPASGRSKLLDDSFHLALSGYSSMGRAMEFTKYLHKEMNYSVWKTVQLHATEILKLLHKIKESRTAELLEKYIWSKIAQVFHKIEKTPIEMSQSGSIGMLREMLMVWSCKLGSCLGVDEEEIAQFTLYSEDNAPIAKDKQLAIYCSAIENEPDTFVKVLNEFKDPKTLFGKRTRLLQAFSCSTDLTHLSWMVNELFVETSQYFSLSEKMELIKAVANNHAVAEFLLETIVLNVDTFFERYSNVADDVLFGIAFHLDGQGELSPKLRKIMPKLNERMMLVQSKLLTARRRQAILGKSIDLHQWLLQNQN